MFTESQFITNYSVQQSEWLSQHCCASLSASSTDRATFLYHSRLLNRSSISSFTGRVQSLQGHPIVNFCVESQPFSCHSKRSTLCQKSSPNTDRHQSISSRSLSMSSIVVAEQLSRINLTPRTIYRMKAVLSMFVIAGGRGWHHALGASTRRFGPRARTAISKPTTSCLAGTSWPSTSIDGPIRVFSTRVSAIAAGGQNSALSLSSFRLLA